MANTMLPSAGQGVGHGHMHNKALLEIILLKAVVLPRDSDIDDCIRSFIVTIAISEKAVATLCPYCYRVISPQWHCFS